MKFGFHVLTASAVVFAYPLAAQESTAPLPVSLAAQPAAKGMTLPANTEVLLRLNQDVTTKGKQWSEGDSFDLSVVHDVELNGYVVIPAGSRGVGQITWLTDKGMFGKSGKMDIELEYIEVGGRRIDVNGTYRQEGEGNTLATVGGVIVAGIFGGFITGRSALIPQGRELKVHTENDLALALPGADTVSQPVSAAGALPVQPVQPPLPQATITTAPTRR